MSIISRMLFAALVLAVTPIVGSAQDTASVSAATIVQRFVSAVNAHDVDGVMELVHPTSQWYQWERGEMDLDMEGSEMREDLEREFRPENEFAITIEHLSEVGRFVNTTLKATWERRGRSRENVAIVVFEIDDGQIRRAWSYLD